MTERLKVLQPNTVSGELSEKLTEEVLGTRLVMLVIAFER
jgi:hypothetical protein